MIEKWFEPFTLLAAVPTGDGLGAAPPVLTDDIAFQGVLTFTTGEELAAGGQAILAESPILLYDLDVTLAHGDLIRREKDGSIFRVTGKDMRAPSWSGLRFAQTSVERQVIPC